MAAAASAAAARIGAVLSDAQYFESGMVRVEDIRRLLDSNSLKDKLDAMKRIVALISLGRDASVFFPDVVKNVVAPSLDVKKLVYMYLVHYAEDKQDLALLSVNSFQKDISDHNELIRALALRVLSSIRVKVILQIVILAVDKCAKDPSPYVRKAAVHAISKVMSIDGSSRETLLEPLAALLNDRSLEVLGSAVAVLDEIAPDRLDLVHVHFRYLCRSLHAMDPSSQVAALRVLLRYGRTQFTRQGVDDGESEDSLDPDLKLLLFHAQALLTSQHSSVVLSVIAILFHLSNKRRISTYATVPLLRLVGSSDGGVQFVALRVAIDLVSLCPEAIICFMSDFFVSGADGASVKSAKLAVLSRLCETADHPGGLGSNSTALKLLLTEFETYLFSSDRYLAPRTTRAMGLLAAAHSKSAAAVIDTLSSVVAISTNAAVVGEAVTVLRTLLQFHPKSQDRALPKLMSLLLVPRTGTSCITNAEARAAIIWLIGEFYEIVPHVAPEALRLLIRGFCEEEAEVKLQILSLAVKVVCWERRRVNLETKSMPVSSVSLKVREQLLDCAISFGMLDCDFDVRDKSRILRNIVRPTADSLVDKMDAKKLNLLYDTLFRSQHPNRENKACLEKTHDNAEASLVFGRATEGKSDAVLGSLSHIIGSAVRGCRVLPCWASNFTDSELRREADPCSRTGGGVLEVASVSSTDFAHMSVQSGEFGHRVGGVSAIGTQNVPARLSVPYEVAHAPRPQSAAQFYDSETSSASESGSESSSDASDSSDDPDTDDVIGDSSLSAVDEVLGVTPVGVIAPKPRVSTVRDQTDHESLFFEAANSPASQELADASTLTNASVADRASPWYTTIASWNAAGLELQVCFVANPPKASISPAATQMLFRLTNTGRERVSNISVSSPAIAFDEMSTSGLLSLSPGQIVDFHGSCNFGGRTVACTVKLSHGINVCETGDIRPHAGHVLRPVPSFSLQDFDKSERSLRGMFGCSSKFSVPIQGALASGEDVAHTAKSACRSALLQDTFLTEIESHVVSVMNPAHSKSMRFAGKLPVNADSPLLTDAILVLVRVDVDAADMSNINVSPSELTSREAPLTVWIGCENVVYANTLLQTLRRVLADIEG